MKKMNKTALGAAVAIALGVAAVPQTASAQVLDVNWTGYFRMLDPNGAGLANSSLSSKVNQYETAVTGTMHFDTTTGAGSGTMVPFSFFSNPINASLTGLSLQAIGNGVCTSTGCGAGPLVLANMLFNWGGNNGIPVSIVLDASGFFGQQGTGYTVGQVINSSAPGSVRGAADGTYIGIGAGIHRTSGYMDLGVVPIATTKYNTTPTCVGGGGNSGACMNVSPSGSLPLVVDTTANANDFVPAFMGGTGQSDNGMGGNPMLAGPFQGYNANFDFTSVTITNVPVPAAAWLFGSGLVGLVGVARRKKA